MTRFLHITDLHLRPKPPEPGSDTADTIGALHRLIASVAGMPLAPDFIIASGDLTDAGDAHSYRTLQDAMAQLPMPVIYALGNHDKRDGYHSVFGDGPSDAPLDYDLVQNGLHVIVLDSGEPGFVSGKLQDAQFARLETMLAHHPQLPKLLVIHHPPHLGAGCQNWTSLDPQDSARLAQMLHGTQVLAILSGHIHINRVALWHGIPVINTMGQETTLDPLRDEGISILRGTGYAVCDLRPSGLSVTHVSLDEPDLIREVPADTVAGFK
jgi:3',5'-cyclic AMP phosphodiesterase CpdA